MSLAYILRNVESTSIVTTPVLTVVDVLYVAAQAHKIVNVALHREYSPGIIFIFSQGRKDLFIDFEF
jgi:hypothetical protein